MIHKIAISIIPAVVLVSVGALVLHGAFRQVVITEQIAGPWEFVYRTAPHGDFKAVRRITTELEATFRAAGIEQMLPLDIYFPGTEPAEIGFTVSSADAQRLARLPNAPLHRVIPPQEFLTATLPYRSPFSFMVGFWKIEPALRDYRASNGLKQTWAGTINQGTTILYLQPKEAADGKAGS